MCGLKSKSESGTAHHADRLVRFAGVGGDDVLEDRFDGLRHVGVRDSDKVVVHGLASFLQSDYVSHTTAPRILSFAASQDVDEDGLQSGLAGHLASTHFFSTSRLHRTAIPIRTGGGHAFVIR